MSWLSSGIKAIGKGASNVGKAVVKGAKDTGHVVGQVASNPIVQGGLGLATGGLAAPILAGVAGGLLKPGGNIGQAAHGGLSGAVSGGIGKGIGKLAPAALSAFGVGGGGQNTAGIDTPIHDDGAGGNSYGGGDQNLLGEINDFAKGHIPGLSGLEGFVNDLGLGKAVSGLGNFVTGNGGMNALGIAQGINAAALQNQSSGYAKDALHGVQDSYNQRAPLRVAGIQGMLNPQTNDIGSLTAHSGPYGKGLPKIAPARAYSATGAPA